jgi:hypothetical protein
LNQLLRKQHEWRDNLRDSSAERRRGFDLISEALPFGTLWYENAEAAAGYAEFYGRSRNVKIRLFNE